MADRNFEALGYTEVSHDLARECIQSLLADAGLGSRVVGSRQIGGLGAFLHGLNVAHTEPIRIGKVADLDAELRAK